MTEPQDEASETVRAGMRTAMVAAVQTAQRTIRQLEQREREIQAASQQRAAELQARFDAERATARAVLAPVGRDEWWATAEPEQIASAYETAHAWERFDPDARVVADRIRAEVRIQHGIDHSFPDRGGKLRNQSAEEGQETRLNAAAAVAVGADTTAETRERGRVDAEHRAASQQRADALWDSTERRTDLAASLVGAASAEAVNARLLVDIGQGKPARISVDRPIGKPSTAAISKPARTLASNRRIVRPRGL